MTKPVLKKTVDLLKSPARNVDSTLNRLRPLLFAGIAAVAVTATIVPLWYLFSFFMERDLLMFLFKPLIVAAPLTAVIVAALMALDFSKLDHISFRLKKHKHVENPDTNLQPESVRSA